MEQIKIEDLQEFVSEHPGIIYTRTFKKKFVIGVGTQNYMVYKRSETTSEWELVHVGIQPFPASDIYNNL